MNRKTIEQEPPFFLNNTMVLGGRAGLLYTSCWSKRVSERIYREDVAAPPHGLHEMGT